MNKIIELRQDNRTREEVYWLVIKSGLKFLDTFSKFLLCHVPNMFILFAIYILSKYEENVGPTQDADNMSGFWLFLCVFIWKPDNILIDQGFQILVSF